MQPNQTGAEIGTGQGDGELKPLRRTGAYLTRSDVTWRQAVEGTATMTATALVAAVAVLVVAARRRRRT
jgi:MYXO-CTERM domain-containing protein